MRVCAAPKRDCTFCKPRSCLGCLRALERILKRLCYVERLAFLRLIKLEPGGSNASSIHHENWRTKIGAGVFAAVMSALSLGASVPADAGPSVNEIRTATPIKHVIIIVGENRSFDHLFATYVPKSTGRKSAQSPVREDHQCRRHAGPEIRQGASVSRSPPRRMAENSSAARISRTRRCTARCRRPTWPAWARCLRTWAY